MNLLFIGGTGIISSGCAAVALERGLEVTLLNRGRRAAVPAGCRHLRADIRDPEQARRALEGLAFDAVVDFVAFEPAHVETDLALFRGRCSHYVFISSASAYQTPPARLPITEETPLDNPFWEYSRRKIACEQRLRQAMAEGVPATIVRPSHTYGRGPFPFDGGYTVLQRIRDGRPVVVPGDGTSVWTMTHHRDFAVGLLGLLGKPATLGEAFHITNDEWLTWNGIFATLGRHLGREPVLAHVPTAAIRKADAEWGASVWGDKAHSGIFDNGKLHRLVPEFRTTIPFEQGARDIVDWYREDQARAVVDTRFDALQDRLAAIYARALDSV
jgi:nucleoside-diphosphate-sugar epimerase